jgi:hypothetical protein
MLCIMNVTSKVIISKVFISNVVRSIKISKHFDNLGLVYISFVESSKVMKNTFGTWTKKLKLAEEHES